MKIWPRTRGNQNLTLSISKKLSDTGMIFLQIFLKIYPLTISSALDI